MSYNEGGLTWQSFTGASDYAPPEVEPFARDDTLPTMSLDSDEDDIEVCDFHLLVGAVDSYTQ